MPIIIRREKGLAIGRSNAKFVQALTGYLKHAGIEVNHAIGDAVMLIIRTAIELSRNNNVVV